MKATDMHYCETYHCKMTVAACASRHANATSGKRGAESYRAGCADVLCRDCAVGKKLLDALPAEYLAEYKNALRGCRISANRQHKRQHPSNPLPPEASMKASQKKPVEPATKICSHKDCHATGQPQPVANFYNDKKSKDGKTGYCKTCFARLNKEYHKRKHDKPNARKSPTSDQSAIAQPQAAPKPVSQYVGVAANIGALAEGKLAAHGDTTGNTGKILRVLYPDGIAPDQYDDMLSIARILERICCIATDKQSLGEALFTDIAEAGILGLIKSQSATEARK